jgi:acylphosphatase
VRLTIEGRVQGVGFRWSLRERARSRGLAGWAANRADGSVEAVLEGEDDAVEAVVEWCRSGPRGAAVKGVEVQDEEPHGERAFEVR